MNIILGNYFFKCVTEILLITLYTSVCNNHSEKKALNTARRMPRDARIVFRLFICRFELECQDGELNFCKFGFFVLNVI